METISKSLRIAVRSLARRPGLVLVVVLCLGLGLGVNAAMLVVVEGLVWSPPAGVEEPERVHRLYATREYPGAGPVTSDVFSLPAFGDVSSVREGDATAYARTEVVVGKGMNGRKRQAELVSPEYFSLLGVRPARGRFFRAEDLLSASGTQSVVLSHRLWHSRFGADPEVVGELVDVQGRRLQVIGIAPPGFSGVELRRSDLWLSTSAMPWVFGDGIEASRGSQIVHVLVRARPGELREPLAAGLTAYYRSIHASEAPGSPDAGAQLSLWPLLRNRGPSASREAKVAAWTAMVAFLVLLVAIANVSNLLIVRGVGRRRESALRVALGAGRADLMRDVLAEGAVLTVGGILGAIPVAFVTTALVRRVFLPDLPATERLVDGHHLVVSGGLAVATALACSLLAAVPLRRLRLSSELRSGATATGGHRALRNGLLVGQMALASVLLIGAGLFLRSLWYAKGLDLGLDPARLLVVSPEGDALPGAQIEELLRDAGRSVEAFPGVETTAVVATPPFGPSYGVGISVPERDEIPTLPTGGPYLGVVEAGYFETVGLRVIEGRAFRTADHEPSVIVNRTLADLLWEEEGAVGKCLVVGDADTAPCSRVVGVVENARRQRIQEPPTLQIYVPIDQGPEWISDRALVVRVAGEPSELMEPIRRELMTAGPGLPYVDVTSLEETLSPQYSAWRLGANVFSLFAALAVFLAVAGVYGLTTYTLAQRRRELGIRMALGARSRGIQILVAKQGLGLAMLGVALGLGGGVLLGRALREQLFEVLPWDPATLAAAVAGLVLATILSIAWSVRRIRRLDPVEVLASE